LLAEFDTDGWTRVAALVLVVAPMVGAVAILAAG
jgi:hypothetical protein